MDGLKVQLRDIEGLDPIGWWPPAPGWWGLAALFLLTLATWSHFYRRYRYKQAESWLRDIETRLTQIERETGRKEKIAALSEVLRLAAIRKYGRNACAGLEGQAWLDWLTDHDADGFDWRAKGRILTKAPYAPNNRKKNDKIKDERLSELIEAAKRWVK